jgi:hypothetical protein
MLLLKNRAVFIATVVIFYFVTFSVKAQRNINVEEKPPLSERMFFGGNFAMQFGTITFIDVSPLAGVMITDRFSSGLGITYQYFKDNRFIGGENNIYGGRIFSRYNVLPNVFVHAEYESLNLDLFNPLRETFERSWVPGLFVGGGYFAPFGNRGGANFTFLYNLIYDNVRSPYNQPYVIRVGFML